MSLMIRRLAAAMVTLACACASHAQEARAPAKLSTCEALDAEYSIELPKLDRAVDDAVAIARRQPNERNWAKAQVALADLAASKADYKSLHTKQACATQRFELPDPWERERPTDDSVKPSLLKFTDSAARTAGIGVLREAPLPEGETELRIWIGFGVVSPDHMLRVRVDASGAVTGDVLQYFPHYYARLILEGSTPGEAQEMWDSVAGACDEVREGTDDDTCFVKPKRRTDWRAVQAKLVNMRIETLPDQDELPADNIQVFDGVAMVVEVRKGADYRAYYYGNPSFHAQPEAQAAAGIMDIAWDTIRREAD